MEGEIDEKVVLDYAVFHISPSQKSYEAFVFNKGLMEKVACGPLDQLKLHLQEACNQSEDNFKLQISGRCTDSSWFTKFTLARFLHIVCMPENFNSTNAIMNEMAQLEETKKFHLALYSKGHSNHSEDETTGCMKELGLMQKIKLETASSDDTKNELLRAMELRLTLLKEKLAASFSQATGATCSTKQIFDIAAFAQYFGATDLRNCLSKYLSLISTVHPSGSSVEQSTSSHDLQLYSSKPATNAISPAKIAQAERQSSTESDGSSELSDEDQSFAERSRPLLRPASPRRSSSPMRRVQIGRSGSRKSTALTIKSLNFFPARDRTASNRDVDAATNRDVEGANGKDEESEQPPKKTENSVRKMSVQDKIHMFESKQKDQTVDTQKTKASGEISLSTNKSVLRRWSAGVVDSFSHTTHESVLDSSSECSYKNPIHEAEEKIETTAKAEFESLASSPKKVEDARLSSPSKLERTSPSQITGPDELVETKAVETNDRAAASAEWSQQKEAELNQMLAKIMDSKPGKYRGASPSGRTIQDTSSEQRGGFYNQYKERRDEKLRAENVRIRAAKEDQFKVMQETNEQIKLKMSLKTAGFTDKHDRPNLSQKPRRNSSPPVLVKKEISKPTSSKKPSPKPSSLHVTRNSLSSGPLPRKSGTPPAKLSIGTKSSNLPMNRQKPQPTPSPTKQSPRPERPLQQPKGQKGTRGDAKPCLKGQEENPLKTAKKTTPSPRAKNISASLDDSGVKSTKPSLYNKVTKKGSVVPLESKPFLRKGTRIGPGVGPVVAKTKAIESHDSSKNSGNLIQAEDTEPLAVIAEPDVVAPEPDLIQKKPEDDVNLEVRLPVVNRLLHKTTENSDQSLSTVDNAFKNSAEISEAEIQMDEDMGISSAAWVEIDHSDPAASCDNDLPEITVSPELAPVPSSSPRVRHSLSHMLQADNCEPDIIEWGSAGNPTALVYHKDAPKGFKRLLKFALKNKGELNNSGSASPSVFSEGEDDVDESKTASKRSSDGLSRKVAIQAKTGGQQRAIFRQSFDSASNRAVDHRLFNDTAQSSKNNATSLGSDKLREGGHISATSTSTSTKATRSFFSLSTFRSGKSSETKLR